MKSILKSNDGPAVRNRPLAFTLIELPFVIAVIALLVGVLLPAVQRTREADNLKGAKADLAQILAKEKAFSQLHAAYTNSLSLLGLGATYPNDSLDGYIFTITVSNTTTLTVTAMPVNPGLNGSVDLTMDQTGKIIESPDPNAEAVHQTVTADIENNAMQAMAEAITVTDTTQIDISTITHKLLLPGTIKQAFLAFAPNGKLTVSDILNYSGLGSTGTSLLNAITTDFQFGTGSEGTDKISLTLGQTIELDSFTFGVNSLLNVMQGTSRTSSTDVSLCGLTIGTITGGDSVTLHNPAVLSTITLYSPPSSGTGFVYSGPLTITDVAGNEIDGFVVGELLPAVQAGATGSKGKKHIELVVIALNGTGVTIGGGGLGTADLALTALGDPITGTLLVEPPK